MKIKGAAVLLIMLMSLSSCKNDTDSPEPQSTGVTTAVTTQKEQETTSPGVRTTEATEAEVTTEKTSGKTETASEPSMIDTLEVNDTPAPKKPSDDADAAPAETEVPPETMPGIRTNENGDIILPEV